MKFTLESVKINPTNAKMVSESVEMTSASVEFILAAVEINPLYANSFRRP